MCAAQHSLGLAAGRCAANLAASTVAFHVVASFLTAALSRRRGGGSRRVGGARCAGTLRHATITPLVVLLIVSRCRAPRDVAVVDRRAFAILFASVREREDARGVVAGGASCTAGRRIRDAQSKIALV